MEEGIGRGPPQKGEFAGKVTLFVDLTVEVGRISTVRVHKMGSESY